MSEPDVATKLSPREIEQQTLENEKAGREIKEQDDEKIIRALALALPSIILQANVAREYFLHLKGTGFDDAQALEITRSTLGLIQARS